MEPITTMAALGAGTHALSLLRGVTDGVKALGKTEIVQQLIDAQVSMMDLLNRHQEMANENAALKETIRDLEEKLHLVREIRFHHEAYWLPRANGTLDGPFSPMVWDFDRKLVRMHLQSRIQPPTSAKPTHIKFVCLTHTKYSDIPFEFMEQNQVMPIEELLAKPPPPQPPISRPSRNWAQRY